MEEKEERQVQDKEQLEKILRKITERIKQGGDSIVVDREELPEYVKKELTKRKYCIYPIFCGRWRLCICW